MTVPDWPGGTVVVLSTTDEGGAPHAIPVSTAVRTGDSCVHLVLGHRRGSLANLRRDPRCALTVLAGSNNAFTLHGHAIEVADDVHGTVAVRMQVERVQDHLQPGFSIEAGVAWSWTDEEKAARDEAIRAALHRLGG